MDNQIIEMDNQIFKGKGAVVNGADILKVGQSG